MCDIKLVTVTWSNEDEPNIDESFLVKSFLKKNKKSDLINIHFNRNNYEQLENEFKSKFGYQYEFLLYRIFLLKDILVNLNNDLLIFSDTGDVVCVDNIQILKDKIPNNIIFSSENHRYPNEDNILNWELNYKYPKKNYNDVNFLNAGISFGSRINFINLLSECINEIFPKKYTNFGGDQGVFTYYYINNNLQTNLIKLDNEYEIFLSTYSKSYHDFYYEDGKLINYTYKTRPLFIHDNGWNYGSPKFISHFNLL